MGYRDDVRWAQKTGAMMREEYKQERERMAREHEAKFAGLPQPGTRVMLLGTDDIYTRLQPGDKGTVNHIDALGTIHVDWDSGSRLGLVYGHDRWDVVSS